MQVQRLPRAAASSQKRLVSISLVAAMHVAAVYALIVTLKPVFTPKVHQPISFQIIEPKNTPTQNRPIDLPAKFYTPATDTPVPPEIFDSGPTQTTRTPPSTNPIGTAGGPQIVPMTPMLSPARAIASTHTIPAYPPIAARLNEQGSVRLQLSIDEQGYVTDASVVASSGYEALDTAAVAWVKAHWRYAPAMQGGAPVNATTEAVVTFRLTNRQG